MEARGKKLEARGKKIENGEWKIENGRDWHSFCIYKEIEWRRF